VLEFVDEVVAEDQVFESHGEKVIIDPKSLAYLTAPNSISSRKG
jgi:iron-sulfur cluster assembly protein